MQLEEQERQVAQLRARIALLEGGDGLRVQGPGETTVDDFSIKVCFSLSLWIDHTTRDDDTSYRMPLRSLINLSTDGLPT